ncbi:hypothetical protein [Roseiarcus fermentans]|uniref:hypothetical protein n=1 Tax=Roseiarcus fermentans TaxID=1473586 RepID=UPI001472C8AC|nr:hypothetical protein [Roseiarcus fermentans]
MGSIPKCEFAAFQNVAGHLPHVCLFDAPCVAILVRPKIEQFLKINRSIAVK